MAFSKLQQLWRNKNKVPEERYDIFFKVLLGHCLKESSGTDKSVMDSREYRSVTLSNGLEALLVQDTRIERIGLALSVGVGYFNDPPEIAGLAHLLEHMMIIGGNAKYPTPGTLDDLISRVSGRKNAYTDEEETNFQFSLPLSDEDVFIEILDVFVNNFISPTFDEAAIERESKVIDNEFSNNLGRHIRRVKHLIQATSNSELFSKFGCGNAQTLLTSHNDKNLNVQTALKDFFLQNYSAHIMKLVIVGPYDASSLERYVMKVFSSLPNRRIKPVQPISRLISESEEGRRFDVVPLDETQEIILYWAFDNLIDLNREKPYRFIFEVLSRRTEGSLQSFLERNGWAKAVIPVEVGISKNSTLILIIIKCTEIGIWEHTDDIIASVFSYLRNLREEGMTPSFVKYLSLNALNSFMKPKSYDPFFFARDISSNMQLYEKKRYLTADKIFYSFKEEDILKMINLLSPRSMQVLVLHRGAQEKVDEVEPIYGIEYSVSQISNYSLDLYNQSTSGRQFFNFPILPEAPEESNRDEPVFEFETPVPASIEGMLNLPRALTKLVPDKMGILVYSECAGKDEKKIRNTAIFPVQDQNKFFSEKVEVSIGLASILQPMGVLDGWRRPCLIRARENCLLWMKQQTLEKPGYAAKELIVSALIHQPDGYGANANPRNGVLLMYYLMFLDDSLSSIRSSSIKSDVRLEVSSTPHGIYLLFCGMDSRIVAIILDTLQTIKSPERFKASNLRTYKLELMKSLERRRSTTYGLASLNMDFITSEPRWSYDDLESHAKTVKFREIISFTESLFRNRNIQVLITGNVVAERAMNLCDLFEEYLLDNDNPHSFPCEQVVQLEQDKQYFFICRNPISSDPNSAIKVKFQIIDSTSKNRAHLFVLAALIDAPCRDFLRTKEAVGYVVESSVDAFGLTLWLEFMLQSNKYDPLVMDEKLEEFLQEFQQILNDIDEDELRKTKETVITKLQGTPSTSKGEHQMWSYYLHNSSFAFDITFRISQQIFYVTKESLQKFFFKFFSVTGRARRKIVSGILAEHHESSNLRSAKLEINHGYGDLIGFSNSKCERGEICSISNPYDFKYEHMVQVRL